MSTNARGDIFAFTENYPHEDFHMQQARKNGAELGAIDPTAGAAGFISTIAQMVHAKSIVEIGTGSGVGALWLFAGTDKDSAITSIDPVRENSLGAKAIVDEAGYGQQRLRCITGAPIDVVNKLADTNYDLVVIRVASDLVDLVQEIYRLLKNNGVLIIDNALDGGRVADPTQRDAETVSRRDAVKSIKEDDRWSSTITPIGGGLLLAVKVNS
jgi:predicted O-methyltransferase YrrM